MYANKSVQFVGLVKGEYGHTPVEIDPAFRLEIAGVSEMTPYDTSKYQMQPNPVLENCGGVKLAETEKEVLLLELFPLVAKDYLTKTKTAAWNKAEEERLAREAEEEAKRKAEEEARKPKIEPVTITGFAVEAPLPGTILEVTVKVGDTVKKAQGVVTLEAMKMENIIDTDVAGVVKRIFVEPGQVVREGTPLVEIE
jgi:biotin carboxyl carrier protein